MTANAQSKVYGTADPALTYTNGALQNGDTNSVFTGGLARVGGQNVGTYAINQGTLSAGANYTISYTGNNLTITPYLLTVTANTQSKIYGAADPALTYTNGALQNGDTNAVFTGGLVRVAGQHVGVYAINKGSLSAGANYTISYTGNNLTITPYLLTVTANAQSKIYGAADPALTYSNGALQNGDTNAVFTGSLVRVAGETVAGGPYAINQGTLSAGANYTISYIGNNLTINPATLTITADNIHKIFGTTYTFLGTEFTAAGLANGDTVTSATLVSAGAPAAATTPGSPYAIIVSAAVGSGLANYNLVYDNGVMFVVTPVTTPVIPPTVITVANGGGSSGSDGGTGGDIRTKYNTSASLVPINPCVAVAAKDTLPDQMTAMLDLIRISPELAETLPFYKMETHSFDAAHIACGDSDQPARQ